MPVVAAESGPKRRRLRGGRALYLLLLAPLLLSALLGVAFFQPISLPTGDSLAVLLESGISSEPGFLGFAIPQDFILVVRRRQYLTTDKGWMGGVAVGKWVIGIAWFRGHRIR